MSDSKARLFLIDDDADALMSLSRALGSNNRELEISGYCKTDEALAALKGHNPEVVVLDLSLDPIVGVESGLAVLREALKIDPTCRVIILTGHSALEHGLRSLENGAANFLEKPADLQHLSALVRDGISQARLRRELLNLKQQSPNQIENLILGQSSEIKLVRDSLLFAAHSNQSVLITGETGTGKGLCALAIHKLRKRANSNFIRYQPNFNTADLVNSELFGHIKGAFTGATENRRGLIADAANGTLFLDEIDELPIETQVALLGVLQDRKFRSIGANQETSVDFKLISATNCNIDQALDQGKLRRDLFHRIAHLRIHLPALRERKEDILPLAESFLANFRRKEQSNILGIDDSACELLLNYDWPGNVRELEACIEGAAYRAQFYKRLYIQTVDLNLIGPSASSITKTFHEQVLEFKLKIINDALNRNSGNQLRAAEELGMERSSLRRLLETSKK